MGFGKRVTCGDRLFAHRGAGIGLAGTMVASLHNSWINGRLSSIAFVAPNPMP